MMLVNGYSGEHSIGRIEAAAVAPYPCAGDIQLDGVWLSDALEQARAIDQAYDFSCGELTSRIEFSAGDVQAQIEILTFCDRVEPTLVCQELTIDVSAACDV